MRKTKNTNEGGKGSSSDQLTGEHERVEQRHISLPVSPKIQMYIAHTRFCA